MIDSTASITGASLEAGIGRPRAVQARGGDGFVQALRQELERTGGRQIAFSKHAMERAEERYSKEILNATLKFRIGQTAVRHIGERNTKIGRAHV